MSTALGIASVTHVLKDLLNNGLVDQDVTGIINGNVQVTALPPDRIDTAPANEQSGLNLFMYQVGPNPGWRNEGLPAYDGQGQRINNPPLALDLHYLLTAYGAEELHAEILLGYGMQLFHETPVLARDAIRLSLSAPSVASPSSLPPALRLLSTSELAEQVEQIKLTPESLSAEDVSRLWTAFQAKYRLTASYKATVVLIQSHKSTRPALPVLRRNLYAQPFRHPVIDQLKSQAPAAGAPVVENQKILAGYKVVVAGRQLKNDLVTVTIDGAAVKRELVESVSESELVFTVPNTVTIGVHGVQIVHQLLMGSPPAEHRGSASNLEAFVLSPTLTAVTYTNVSGSGASPRAGTLNLTVAPAVLAPQQVLVLLNELTVTDSKAYSFRLPTPAPTTPPTQNLTVEVQNVKAGHYLVRVQVDGAESPLDTDASGAFTSPQVDIS